jgi:hypothetical protein
MAQSLPFWDVQEETDLLEDRLLQSLSQEFPQVGLRDVSRAVGASTGIQLTGDQHTLVASGFPHDCWLPLAVAMQWRGRSFPTHPSGIGKWRRFKEQAASTARQAKHQRLGEHWQAVMDLLDRKLASSQQIRQISLIAFWERVAQQLLDDLTHDLSLIQMHVDKEQSELLPGGEEKSQPPRPRYDAKQRELWYGDELCRHYKRPAPNREKVLNSFEELGWPDRIDDPLDRGKLADTVRDLQRDLRASSITFERDGTGKGIIWKQTRIAAHGAQNP